MTVIAAGALVVGGCASDGRDLAEPQDWQTTTTRPAPPTSAPTQETSPSGLSISSPDFAPGDMAPASATCAGDNKFPTLTWTDVPAEAEELAIALSDQTDPENPLLVWLMVGIDPALGELAGGTLPVGGAETLNDFGQLGYGNPCLENVGDGLRDLQFRVYALTNPSGLEEGAHGHDSWDTVAAMSFDTATLMMQVQAQSP